MQKIKYIIILILVLLLGFVYIQLSDYNKISNSLLQQNSSSNKKIDTLEAKISSLEANNQLLQDNIATLKEEVFLLEEELVLIKYETIDTTNEENLDLDNDQPLIDKNKINNKTNQYETKSKEKSIFDTFFKQ